MRTQLPVLASLFAGMLAATSAGQQCCTGNVSTYCTAGTSVQGCLPHISGVGVPSADAANGFEITVSGVPAQRYGTIFYGFYAASQPWAPFSPSLLCVAPPVQRTGNIASGGAPASCTGQLALEFNAWRAMNPTALGSPFLTGQTIRAQGWYRDPAAPGQTNLSDALVFNLCNGSGDTTPPVITTCAANQTVGTTVGCLGVIPDLTGGVAAVDNCTPVAITQSPAAGTSVPLGVTVVTITVTDALENASQCIATVTVTPSGTCQTPQNFVAIQPGTFQMGSSAASGFPYYNDIGWSPQPVHSVTITYPFWMCATEVTQAQYSALMGTNPSNFQGDPNRPVEQVTWFDARAYCVALTAQQSALGAVPSGYEYRLPTEAEWEYACRAGTTSEFNVGAQIFCSQARIDHSAHSMSFCVSGSPCAVGSYAPNAWGLHDMHGNVWEWCLDSIANYLPGAITDPFVSGGVDRVLRGGGWNQSSYYCRSGRRGYSRPALVNHDYGFRVVLGPILIP